MTTAKEYSSFSVETELIAGDDDRLVSLVFFCTK